MKKLIMFLNLNTSNVTVNHGGGVGVLNPAIFKYI